MTPNQPASQPSSHTLNITSLAFTMILNEEFQATYYIKSLSLKLDFLNHFIFLFIFFYQNNDFYVVWIMLV